MLAANNANYEPTPLEIGINLQEKTWTAIQVANVRESEPFSSERVRISPAASHLLSPRLCLVSRNYRPFLVDAPVLAMGQRRGFYRTQSEPELEQSTSYFDKTCLTSIMDFRCVLEIPREINAAHI